MRSSATATVKWALLQRSVAFVFLSSTSLIFAACMVDVDGPDVPIEQEPIGTVQSALTPVDCSFKSGKRSPFGGKVSATAETPDDASAALASLVGGMCDKVNAEMKTAMAGFVCDCKVNKDTHRCKAVPTYCEFDLAAVEFGETADGFATASLSSGLEASWECVSEKDFGCNTKPSTPPNKPGSAGEETPRPCEPCCDLPLGSAKAGYNGDQCAPNGIGWSYMCLTCAIYECECMNRVSPGICEDFLKHATKRGCHKVTGVPDVKKKDF